MASAEMRKAALAGGPNRKANPNAAENSNTTELEQGETALGAALREALARKAVVS